MDVSIVITCWNGKELLKKNLPEVIQASQNPKNKIVEIIVVDDGSIDNSAEFLENAYPQVKVVRNEQNLGYGAACNSGVGRAKADLVAILNTDVVPKKDFLVPALTHFKDEKVFAVSFNESKYGPGKLVWKKGFLEIESTEVPQETSLTDWPNGGSSVFQKSVWQRLGGMDKLFLPFYFEDIDLGIRSRQAGFKCLWEPRAKVEHKHESTINPQNLKKYHFKRNIDLIKQRNHLLLTWRNLDSFKLFVSHLGSLLKRCLSHPKYLRVIFAALVKVGQ